MIIGNKDYNHIEIYNETGQLIGMISDTEIVEYKNNKVILCESEIMFKEK